jgi:hypothetical protein
MLRFNGASALKVPKVLVRSINQLKVKIGTAQILGMCKSLGNQCSLSSTVSSDPGSDPNTILSVETFENKRKNMFKKRFLIERNSLFLTWTRSREILDLDPDLPVPYPTRINILQLFRNLFLPL